MNSKVAKRRTSGRASSSRNDSYSPPKLPKHPRVDRGPKSYGLTKRGKHIICRFHITPYYDLVRGRPPTRWWVADMETGNIAEGSKRGGYEDKEAAMRVARFYRDNFGTWTTLPF